MPEYPDKYRGDDTKIIYRSGWEQTAFIWCDYNPNVVAWQSEEIAIPYYMKGIPYARHYYPDLVIKFKNGEVQLIEIKPNAVKKAPDYENKCKLLAARAYLQGK